MLNRDEIIRMAQEAGFEYLGREAWDCFTASIERLAAATYAAGQTAEREACAEICDRYAMAMDYSGTEYVRSRECQQAAAAIRARGEKGSSE